jgi:fructose-1,6-bisphosphatase/inositol monophosphatase family enzyme
MLSRTVRDDEGDTIFGIDRVAEDVLLPYCEAWGREQSFRLVAEGLEPEGRRFGSGAPEFRVIVDPVDGSRGLMHDKRSAWCLSAIAEEHGDATRLRHVFAALQTELPTTRHGYVDQLWATRGTRTQQRRTCLFDGSTRALPVAPSSSTTLHHGFATVCDFFPGGKEILGRLAERILQAEMGGWNPEKAEIFADQYISSGGQLAEIVLGRDRFVLDVRPLVYASLGVVSSLCARPYDICTALIAQQAGVVVTDPFGEVLDPPLDVSTNVAFAAYANPGLAARLQPLVTEALRTLL